MKFSFRLYPCRLTLINRPCVEIYSRNTSNRKHTVRVAYYTWSHTGTRADPHAVFKSNVTHHQVECGFLEVVVAVHLSLPQCRAHARQVAGAFLWGAVPFGNALEFEAVLQIVTA